MTIQPVIKVLCATVLAVMVTEIVIAQPNTKLTDEQLVKIQFDQKPGAAISATLPFVDDTGKSVRLGDYFGRRPSILILGYYGCPMLCTLVLNGVADCLRNVPGKAGDQYNVIFASIDPAEKPALAADKKASYNRIYENCGISQWHFLTGAENSISNLASEVGFSYVYDPSVKQFAHPSGFVVLTTDGRVSRYFFGVKFSAKDVSEALQTAMANNSGREESKFTLLCFHYAPVHGRYGKSIMIAVRLAGLMMLAVLAGLFLLPSRRSSKAPKT